MNFGSCAISNGKRSNLKYNRLAKQVFPSFLKNEMLINAKMDLESSSAKEIPHIPDPSDLGFQAGLLKLEIMPLNELEVDKKKLFHSDGSEKFKSQSSVYIKENHLPTPSVIQEKGGTWKNSRSLISQSNDSINPTTSQIELMSKTTSYSSMSTVLRSPRDLESQSFLPSKPTKRGKIICCCVG